jgi:feruloyl-CoA synthase
VVEDFKLATGTWVSTGPLRMKFLAHCGSLVRDVVIAGHDRDDVGVLIFPDWDACRQLGDAGAIRARFRCLLQELARSSTGSSNRIARALLLEDAPSIDAHEITDKGSLNQGAILRNSAAMVEELYAPGSLRTILI